MKKRNILILSLSVLLVIFSLTLVMSAASTDATITITKSGGSFETAYVEWSPVSGATNYNVYFKLSSNSNYSKISNMLVRKYSTYCRADILGLEKGTYDIKVVPIINNSESSSVATSKVNVESHLREGFAFKKSSVSTVNPGCGGYNSNGTVPSNAKVLYISKKTVNTVTLGVITSSGGSPTTCTGLVNILTARKKGYDTTPLIIRMIGTITASDISGLNSSGYLEIKGCTNITLEGVGEDATVNGWGLLIRSSTNIEIRNLGIMLFPDDGVSLDTDNNNIWIHNNDIFYGTAGSDADQAKGDGSCDTKKSNYITVSYNHFWDSGKAMLCGLSESSEFFVSYHHNWFDHSDSRHPRVRTGTIHVYNNYYDGVSKYGVGATTGSSIFVESNYFRNCKYPMLISLQGTDIYNGGSYNGVGTFSSESGGMIKAYENTIVGASRFVDQTSNSQHFDAVVVKSKSEQVSSSYKTVNGSNLYNNFDTNSSVMYSYTPDSSSNIPTIVSKYAGRLNNGDFKWTFNNSIDDTLDTINTGLMSKLKSYSSSLVSIFGESSPDISTTNNQTTVTTTKIVTTTPTITTSSTKYGDVNLDGKLTSTDTALIERHILGSITLTGTAVTAADINKDGKITSTDPAIIGRYLLGVIDNI